MAEDKEDMGAVKEEQIEKETREQEKEAKDKARFPDGKKSDKGDAPHS